MIPVTLYHHTITSPYGPITRWSVDRPDRVPEDSRPFERPELLVHLIPSFSTFSPFASKLFTFYFVLLPVAIAIRCDTLLYLAIAFFPLYPFRPCVTLIGNHSRFAITVYTLLRSNSTCLISLIGICICIIYPLISFIP